MTRVCEDAAANRTVDSIEVDRFVLQDFSGQDVGANIWYAILAVGGPVARGLRRLARSGGAAVALAEVNFGLYRALALQGVPTPHDFAEAFFGSRLSVYDADQSVLLIL